MCEDGGKLAGEFYERRISRANGESIESAMIINIASTLQTSRDVYLNVCKNVME